MPDETSSTQQTRLPPVNIIASCNLRFCPPESVFERAFSFMPRSHAFTKSEISVLEALELVDFSRSNILTCSATVSSSQRTFFCGQSPSPPFASISIDPLETLLRPAMASSVVDFPLPFAPSRTIICPCRMSSVRSLTATTSSLRFERGRK